jgi:hypothetical protein
MMVYHDTASFTWPLTEQTGVGGSARHMKQDLFHGPVTNFVNEEKRQIFSDEI